MAETAWHQQFRKNVRLYREAHTLTQDELATRVGFTSGAVIAAIEAGEKLPSLGRARELARHLGVSLSELVGDHPRGSTARITNNANGDHQTVYQHVEGLMLTAELEAKLATLVTQVLESQRPVLLEAVTLAVRQVLEARQGRDGSAG